MASDAGPGSTDLYVDLARRRQLAAAVAEEIEIRPDGRRRPWFGVYRWDAVRSALGDEALSSQMYNEVMGLDGRYGPVLVGMDGAEHRRHRAVVQPPFSRSALTERLRADAEDTIDRLVSDLAGRSSADLLNDLCVPLPAILLTEFLGLPATDVDLVRQQATVLASGGPDPARLASDALRDRLLPLIDLRRRHPTGDVISVLTQGLDGALPLDDLEVFSHIRLLAVAGTDTLTRAIANLLFGLLTNPRQLDAVCQDLELVDAAVDEAVRWECPTVSVPRVAVRDTRIGGIEIPQGSAVRCCLASANRDPERWPDPDRFDIFRDAKPSAGFGLGPHACLGVHVTRLVMAQTTTSLLGRLPGLRLDGDGPPAEILGADLRGPTHLRVRWG